MRAAKIAATAQYLVNANDGKEVYYTYNLEKGTVTTSLSPYARPEEDKYDVENIEDADTSRVYSDIKVGVCVENPDIPTQTTKVEIFVNKK